MHAPSSTPDPRAYARLAGVLYLVIIVSGIGGEGLLRGPLLTPGDAAGTVANLLAAEATFRLSILADVAMALSDVALGSVLYVLLKPAGRTLSLMALTFRLAQAAVLGMNLLHLHRAAALLHGGAFPTAQRDALVSGELSAHAAGYDFGLFFFAVNCFLVGVLILRADFLPRVLGALLLAAGAVYLAGSTLRVVAPAAVAGFAPAYGIPLLAELALCLWLLVKGVDAPRWRAAAQRRAT